MAKSTQEFKAFGEQLNKLLKPYNYKVADTSPAGKPGKNNTREFRLQLIDKQRNTSKDLIDKFSGVLKKAYPKGRVQFNKLSPNSSKFSSYTLELDSTKMDLVIAQGANKGEKFEQIMVDAYQKAFSKSRFDPKMAQLIELMNSENKDFASTEIIRVEQRKGSTAKQGIPLERLGEVIGDIILTDSTNKRWYVSLKNKDGATIANGLPGGSTIFNNEGTLDPQSKGSQFLLMFGVDLNRVQAGFDLRNKITTPRLGLPGSNGIPSDTSKIKELFKQIWGMNYFYVREKTNGWEVHWIDSNYLNKLTSGIKVTNIRYPGINTKTITIECENSTKKYMIEVRNTKGGEYPNDIKVRLR